MKLPKLLFFLISFFFISLLNVQITHAQNARISISSHPEPDNTVYVNKGDRVTFQISGLETYTDYRIELGGINADDEFMQYNLSWTDGRACGPASFGPEEPNKGQGLISISTCRVSGTSLTVIATLNTTSLAPVDQFAHVGRYRLVVKQGRNGNDYATEEDKSIIILPPIAIKPDQTSVAAGNIVKVDIFDLAPNLAYGFTLRNSNGQTVYRDMAFTTGDPGTDDCSMTKTAPSFTFEDCIQDGEGMQATFTINTTGFNCSPGSPSLVTTCTLYLTRSGTTLATGKFNVDSQQFSFKMEPSNPVTEEEVTKAGDPRAEFNAYEGQDVVITATGCSQAEVRFEWWRDSEGNAQCTSGVCHPVGEPDDSHTQSISNNSATFTNDFGANGTSELYAVKATCGGLTPIIKTLRVYGSGQEFLQPQEKIEANTEWNLLIGGLVKRTDSPPYELGKDYDACYIIEVQKEGADEPMQGPNSSPCQDIDDGRNPFDGSEDWYPTYTYKMPAMEEGFYEVRLFIIKRGVTGGGGSDNERASARVCIGPGIDCVNATIEDVPPPPPPCNKFNELNECEEVNTAFGILKIDPTSVIPTIFTFLLSISGLIILLIIIRSAYILMTSQGNPEKVKEAQERITSAIVGFLFLIFSLVILETIGVDILRIPGFN